MLNKHRLKRYQEMWWFELTIPHILKYLNTWFLVGSPVCVGSGGVALLEEEGQGDTVF